MVITVKLPHDHNWQALDWAKENCPSYITCISHPIIKESTQVVMGKSIITVDYQYPVNYYFDTEEDAMLFKLRWL